MNTSSITITDLVGEIVYHESLTNHQSIIALDNLETGTYLINIKDGDQMTTKRIVKQ